MVLVILYFLDLMQNSGIADLSTRAIYSIQHLVVHTADDFPHQLKRLGPHKAGFVAEQLMVQQSITNRPKCKHSVSNSTSRSLGKYHVIQNKFLSIK